VLSAADGTAANSTEQINPFIGEFVSVLTAT